MFNHSLYFYIINAFILYYIHSQAKEFYNKRQLSGKTVPKIYDLGHKILPNLSTNNTLKDGLILTPYILLFILSLIYGKEFMLKNSFYFLIIFIIRWFTSSITILPKDKNCDDTKYTIKNLLFGNCYEKIFSGPFSNMLILSFIILHYNTNYNNYLIIINIIYGLLLLMTRLNYSIDIIISLIVVYSITTLVPYKAI